MLQEKQTQCSTFGSWKCINRFLPVQTQAKKAPKDRPKLNDTVWEAGWNIFFKFLECESACVFVEVLLRELVVHLQNFYNKVQRTLLFQDFHIHVLIKLIILRIAIGLCICVRISISLFECHCLTYVITERAAGCRSCSNSAARATLKA